jgi:hypothetical protein
VYDQANNKFVPQDLATYVERTPLFRNKIQEVAGTATLVAPDGVPVVPTVSIVDDASYLPLVGNKNGDITYASDTETLYIWSRNAWRSTKAAENEAPVATPKNVSLVQAGTLRTITGTSRWYAPTGLTINKIIARVDSAATGSAINITIKKTSGVTTTTTNMSLAAGSVKAENNQPNISMNADDYLTLDVTQVGSTAPGTNLRVTFIYT